MGNGASADATSRGTAVLAVRNFSGPEILNLNLLLYMHTEKNIRGFHHGDRDALCSEVIEPMLYLIAKMGTDDARRCFARTMSMAKALDLIERCGEQNQQICFTDILADTVRQVTEEALAESKVTEAQLENVRYFTDRAVGSIRPVRRRSNA
jgi:hypothetical protein